MSDNAPTATAPVLAAFSAAVADHGGTVAADRFDDGRRLFVRGTLPAVREVGPGDGVRGGVALRAVDGAVSVHPYLYRLVCRNGAIRAHAIESRQLTVEPWQDPAEVVRSAVADCCRPGVFAASVAEVRSARALDVDLALTLMPLMARLGGMGSGVMRQVVERLFADGGQTPFGVMNAVTSVARDTADPQAKWDLEELGGGVPVIAPRRPTRPPAARAAAKRPALELVS